MLLKVGKGSNFDKNNGIIYLILNKLDESIINKHCWWFL